MSSSRNVITPCDGAAHGIARGVLQPHRRLGEGLRKRIDDVPLHHGHLELRGGERGNAEHQAQHCGEQAVPGSREIVEERNEHPN